MKKKHLLLFAVTASVALATAFISCNKSTSIEDTSATATQQSVSLYMTDGAGAFSNVYLDIKSIEILVDTSTNTRAHDSCNWNNIGGSLGVRPNVKDLVWDTLNFTAGVYDLLKLRNGVDTLLSTTTIPKGAVRLLRIDLGTQNSIVVDSVSYPLNNVPSFILVKLDGGEWQKFNGKHPNSYRLWLDFDVLHSILKIAKKYYLVPVIKPFIPSTTGAITGNVAPKLALPATLTLINGSDTSMGMPNPDGVFLFRGLKDGTYSLLVHSLRKDTLGVAVNPYADTIISNIKIQSANTVNVGTITLHN